MRQQHVSHWLHNRVPAEWVRAVSAATGMPAKAIRPDLFP